MARMTTHPRRTARRQAAVVRQELRNTRSNDEQLTLIATRRGESKRETARLSA